MSKNIQIIAIDGPAGAGKSTVAKRLAQRLGFAYLDTGAMYRSLTLKALRGKINLEDEAELISLAKEAIIDLEDDPQGVKFFLDGEDVTKEIRTLEVTNKTFYIARVPGVRAVMVEWQRRIASKKSVVVEGRDVGTVVFPHASYKFYLDAEVSERARRRIQELRAKGETVDEQKLLHELQERDHKDFTRKIGPLRKAEDATCIDTTKLTVEQTVEKILKHIKINCIS